jgi:hypothetical protein
MCDPNTYTSKIIDISRLVTVKLTTIVTGPEGYSRGVLQATYTSPPQIPLEAYCNITFPVTHAKEK